MKTGKLVIGIISMVLCAVVTLQSCAAGLVNTVEENGEISGSAGFLLAVCMLIAGIIAVATRNGKKGGYVAGGFYLFGGLIGFAFSGSVYSDLPIWAGLCIIFGIICIIGSWRMNKAEMKAIDDLFHGKNEEIKADILICPNCQHPVRKDLKFCPVCGRKITKDTK